MNIVIAGCGKVGQKLAEVLSGEKDSNITVIDPKQQVVNDLIGQYDIMGVVGSGVSLDTLVEAGVKDADIFIAVTNSDELNLMSCLMARKLGKCQTVARVRKPEYGNSVKLIKEDLGLALVINPEQEAAHQIARSLRFPSAIEIDSFAKSKVEILKFKVEEESVLDGMIVMEIVSKLKCDVLVCGVERDDEAFIPSGHFKLQAGDYVSIITAFSNAAEFFKKIGVKTNRVKDTIIVGGGDTAYYLANRLLQTGITVKIIEKDDKRCEELCKLLPKADIVNGDGSENRLLLEEGVERAESFVSLTNIDEVNILLSLYAKSKMQGGKLITKINRVTYDEVINGLEMDTTVYPKSIVAEIIVKFVRAKKNTLGSNIETIHKVIDDKAEALEFKISGKSSVTDTNIGSLKLKNNTLIACISRDGRVIIPRGYDSILDGDTVIVVTTHSGFQDISDILE